GLAQGGRQRPPRAGKFVKLGHLEENSVNHRIFERTLRPLVSRGACLFERHFTTQAWLGVGRRPSGDAPRNARRRGTGFKRSRIFRFENLLLRLTSDQAGIPAELKHINKRRKRNQQGLP
ncbi:hypothetical protein AOQ84DRAFT_280954, partial [Glonium stellatum]